MRKEAAVAIEDSKLDEVRNLCFQRMYRSDANEEDHASIRDTGRQVEWTHVAFKVEFDTARGQYSIACNLSKFHGQTKKIHLLV
jgi:hypothetical protein